MEFKNLAVNIENRIAIITINRPEKLNALNYETLQELESCFREIKDDVTISCSIITGSGPKAFVAGADINEISKLDPVSGKMFSEYGQFVFDLIENHGKPVIAAINGFALGGGAELALACHIRIASENSRFGQPEVNLGIIPGYGGTQRLTMLINPGRAAELILTGDAISAEEAYRIGIVNQICSQSELMNYAKDLAVKISSKGNVAVQMALKSILYSKQLFAGGLNYESSLFAICCGTDDFKEGTNAFLEKRKASFTNK